MKKLLIFVISLSFVMMSGSVFGQNPDIEIIDLSLENNQLVIYYNITKAKKKQVFDVWPEITTENGQKINASSFSGDYGEGITAGTDKKIIWDYNADGVILNGKVFVELNAKLSINKANISMGSALLLSAIVPGLGITKLKGGGPYWLMSLPVYVTAAGAYANYSRADDNYSKYKDGVFSSPEDANIIYNEAIDAQKQYQIFTYSAIGIWAANMVWTALVAKKNKSLTGNYRKQKAFFYTGINPMNKSVGFTLKYRF
jgi:hypothetical protein